MFNSEYQACVLIGKPSRIILMNFMQLSGPAPLHVRTVATPLRTTHVSYKETKNSHTFRRAWC